jgi:hypothetical protein
MSEQNPPGQPTPSPSEPSAEGVGPTASDEAAAPPPPPGDGTAVVEGDNPPPPPPASGKSKSPWIIGTAVVLVILLVAAGVFGALVVFKKDSHKISTPSSAAGMKRDSKQEAALKQQLAAAETEFKNQFKNVTYVKSAVYNQTDKGKGPQGSLVFLGAKVQKLDSNPTKFVDALRKQATSNGFKVASVSAGDNGGKAVCAAQSTGQKIAICAWATKDSGGELIPIVPGWSADKLASLMRDLRKDVEKTE